MSVHASDLVAIALLAAIVTPAVVGIGRAIAQTVNEHVGRVHRARPGIDATAATQPERFPSKGHVGVLSWLTAWVVAQLAIGIVIAVSGHDEPIPIPTLAAAIAASWSVYAIALGAISRRLGSGAVRQDLGIAFRRLDLIGLPLGILVQVAAVPLLYLPLRSLWPRVFDDERVQRNANELVDRADGISTVMLALIVVLGAPIVEELVYRGLLQRSLTVMTNAVVGSLVTAAIFTVVHFRPAEYPGLAVLALIVGPAAARTRRLGLPIAIHIGFNGAGLALVLW